MRLEWVVVVKGRPDAAGLQGPPPRRSRTSGGRAAKPATSRQRLASSGYPVVAIALVRSAPARAGKHSYRPGFRRCFGRRSERLRRSIAGSPNSSAAAASSSTARAAAHVADARVWVPQIRPLMLPFQGIRVRRLGSAPRRLCSVAEWRYGERRIDVLVLVDRRRRGRRRTRLSSTLLAHAGLSLTAHSRVRGSRSAASAEHVTAVRHSTQTFSGEVRCRV